MKRFFRNIVDAHEDNGGITPLRFTPRQFAYFESTPYSFRCYNVAGVCLDFMTDSPFVHMSFRAKLKPGTTEQLFFDLYIDDCLHDIKQKVVSNQGAGEWTAVLPIHAGSPRRVTIYLPYLARVTIEKLTVADGASWEPVKPHKRNLLCFGDSIMQGMNAAQPSFTYAVRLSRLLEMNLLNQAISGYIFNADMIDLELPYNPNLIIVAYGTNDWSICSSYELFKENASRFISKLNARYPDVPIIVQSPLWRADNQEIRKVGKFAAIHNTLRQLCSEYTNVRYVDGLTLTPHHPEYFADGLHPNDDGFQNMAMNGFKRLCAELSLQTNWTVRHSPTASSESQHHK